MARKRVLAKKADGLPKGNQKPNINIAEFSGSESEGEEIKEEIKYQKGTYVAAKAPHGSRYIIIKVSIYQFIHGQLTKNVMVDDSIASGVIYAESNENSLKFGKQETSKVPEDHLISEVKCKLVKTTLTVTKTEDAKIMKLHDSLCKSNTLIRSVPEEESDMDDEDEDDDEEEDEDDSSPIQKRSLSPAPGRGRKKAPAATQPVSRANARTTSARGRKPSVTKAPAKGRKATTSNGRNQSKGRKKKEVESSDFEESSEEANAEIDEDSLPVKGKQIRRKRGDISDKTKDIKIVKKGVKAKGKEIAQSQAVTAKEQKKVAAKKKMPKVFKKGKWNPDIELETMNIVLEDPSSSINWNQSAVTDNKNVIRAAVTDNIELLKKCMREKEITNLLETWSPEVKWTALEYMIYYNRIDIIGEFI